jgi:hypothetical protein
MGTMGADLVVGLGVLVILILFAVGLVVYFVPSFIAFSRGHPHRRWILILNILGGWTLIAWVAALIWSLATPEGSPFDAFGTLSQTKTCPRCAERVRAAAVVCRYCGHEFGPAPAMPPPPPGPKPRR